MEYAPLSPLGMLMNAGPVSRMVMIVLLAASVWTWVLILDGVYVAWRLSRTLRVARAGGPPGALWPIERAARAAQEAAVSAESAKDTRRRVLEQTLRAATDTMTEARGGLSNLATVSSVAPFIGLFGTVWGIMSSFGSIAETQDTSLAVVAPGIAEALAATAYGLAAAIPAAIGYNRIGAAYARLSVEIRQYVDIAMNSAHPAVAIAQAKADAERSATAASEIYRSQPG